MRIAIDAGHGNNTAGKRTPDDSMREFHFNSVVARYLREELSKYSGVKTLFTHDDAGVLDVPLAARTEAANAWKADIFVSIHANAFGNGWNSVSGIETFTYVTKPADAVKLAVNVQGALINATKRISRGVKAADFHVLRESHMTAILVECGFMTNQAEATLLKTDAYRRTCARAIADGIAKCYGLQRVVRKSYEITVTDTEITDEVTGAVYGGFIVRGVTYAPVRQLAESVGRNVGWDGTNVTLRK